MSSRRSPPVLDIALGPSRLLALLVGCATVLSIAAVCCSGIAWMAKTGIIVFIFGAGIYCVVHKSLRLLPRSAVRLVVMQDEECVLVDRGGRMHGLKLANGLALYGRLAILVMESGGPAKQTLCITADAVNGDLLRQLCVQLRLMPVRNSRWPGKSAASSAARLIRRGR